jgi:hypothetical protein
MNFAWQLASLILYVKAAEKFSAAFLINTINLPKDIFSGQHFIFDKSFLSVILQMYDKLVKRDRDTGR